VPPANAPASPLSSSPHLCHRLPLHALIREHAGRCVPRYASCRTSPHNIAREAGVNRTTIAKLLADEPELVASFMRGGIPEVLERDPHLLSEWIVRLCLSLLFAPSRVELRAFLGAGIRPLFEVESAR
jgi:hypothetical protein